MPATVWKGYVSFGLISVPVRLFAAARYSHISFHEVHRECGTRVRQQLYCPHDERVVARDEVVKGIEVAKGKWVFVDDKELKNLGSPSSSVMEIVQLVNLSEVDPIYFETSYFSVPEEPGRRAYALLLRTMQQLKLAALAKVTLHQRERVVLIRPYENGLTLHTIYYPNEIHRVAAYGRDRVQGLTQREITLSEQFAKGLVKPFRPEVFRDTYQDRVQQLIDSKAKGMSAPKPERPKKLAPVIDLMDALKKSIAQGKHSGAANSKPSRKPARAQAS